MDWTTANPGTDCEELRATHAHLHARVYEDVDGWYFEVMDRQNRVRFSGNGETPDECQQAVEDYILKKAD